MRWSSKQLTAESSNTPKYLPQPAKSLTPFKKAEASYNYSNGCGSDDGGGALTELQKYYDPNHAHCGQDRDRLRSAIVGTLCSPNMASLISAISIMIVHEIRLTVIYSSCSQPEAVLKDYLQPQPVVKEGLFGKPVTFGSSPNKKRREHMHCNHRPSTAKSTVHYKKGFCYHYRNSFSNDKPEYLSQNTIERLWEAFESIGLQDFEGSILFTHRVPRTWEVSDFLTELYKATQFSLECFVIAMIYLSRVLDNPYGFSLSSLTWRPILFAALLVAHKFWDDEYLTNQDFVCGYPGHSYVDANKLERNFLKLVNYNVSVLPSVYAHSYFGCRAAAAVHADLISRRKDEQDVAGITSSSAPTLRLNSASTVDSPRRSVLEENTEHFGACLLAVIQGTNSSSRSDLFNSMNFCPYCFGCICHECLSSSVIQSHIHTEQQASGAYISREKIGYHHHPPIIPAPTNLLKNPVILFHNSSSSSSSCRSPNNTTKNASILQRWVGPARAMGVRITKALFPKYNIGQPWIGRIPIRHFSIIEESQNLDFCSHSTYNSILTSKGTSCRSSSFASSTKNISNDTTIMPCRSLILATILPRGLSQKSCSSGYHYNSTPSTAYDPTELLTVSADLEASKSTVDTSLIKSSDSNEYNTTQQAEPDCLLLAKPDNSRKMTLKKRSFSFESLTTLWKTLNTESHQTFRKKKLSMLQRENQHRWFSSAWGTEQYVDLSNMYIDVMASNYEPASPSSCLNSMFKQRGCSKHKKYNIDSFTEKHSTDSQRTSVQSNGSSSRYPIILKDIGPAFTEELIKLNTPECKKPVIHRIESSLLRESIEPVDKLSLSRF